MLQEFDKLNSDAEMEEAKQAVEFQSSEGCCFVVMLLILLCDFMCLDEEKEEASVSRVERDADDRDGSNSSTGRIGESEQLLPSNQSGDGDNDQDDEREEHGDAEAPRKKTRIVVDDE